MIELYYTKMNHFGTIYKSNERDNCISMNDRTNE